MRERSLVRVSRQGREKRKEKKAKVKRDRMVSQQSRSRIHQCFRRSMSLDGRRRLGSS